MNNAFATDGARLEYLRNIDAPVEIRLARHRCRGAHHRHAPCDRDRRRGLGDSDSKPIWAKADYLANSVIDVTLGEGASSTASSSRSNPPDAIHLAHAASTLGKNAILRDFTLTSGARVNRQNGTVQVHRARRRDARVAGAYLLAGRQHADTRLVIDHQVPKCTSRELFKCVMDEHARGIFQGKVIVQRDAQKTDGKQSSHALLLSETAEFDAKPELEIYRR